MEAVTEAKHQLVTVTLGITTEDGESQTETKSIPSGATKVPALLEELGLPADSSLWVINKNGKKKVLGEHESHNVKEDDHFEALVKGGIS